MGRFVLPEGAGGVPAGAEGSSVGVGSLPGSMGLEKFA
jgi:hypothetical protein